APPLRARDGDAGPRGGHERLHREAEAGVPRAVTVLGVVGAGSMGAGIAQLGAAAGLRTLLHDPVPAALERGTESARGGLSKWMDKGQIGTDALQLLEPVPCLDELAPCDIVIEAAPERADLKRDLFAALSMVCGDDVVLATNTSSIPVTSLAGAPARQENVVGMHFFNPPPLMPLVELIRAEQSSDDAMERARRLGEEMGKEVIVAADGPGFLVNRCGRPFGGEGLRLLQERVATCQQLDRVAPLRGGLRCGGGRGVGPGGFPRRLGGRARVRRRVVRRAALAAEPAPGADGRGR